MQDTTDSSPVASFGSKISPDQAREALSLEALRPYAQLFKQHGEYLHTAEPGAPVNVEYIGNPARNYYLVPIFAKGLDEPWFVAQVSAATGEMLRLDCIRTAQPDENSWIYAVLNEEKARKKLAALLRPHVPDGWVSVKEGCLVWKMCRYSHSPLHPFHKVERTTTSGKEFAYLDIHGFLHTDLDAPAPEDELPPLQHPVR